jgi:tight adherence protein B
MVLVLSIVVGITGPLGVAALVTAARRAGATERARALSRTARWRLPARVRARLVTALVDADVDLEPEPAVEIWAGAVALAALLGAALAPGLAIPAAAMVLAGGPISLVLARGRARRRFAVELPGGLEQIASHLRGGGTVAQGLAALADGTGPLAGDAHRVMARTELGLGLPEALAAWPTERELPEVRAAAGALVVAATMGGRSAAALDGLAASLRDRLGVAAEARSQSAQARMSALVVGGAPLAFVAFSAMADPTAVELLVTTAVGRVCLVIGLSLEALAGLWMRRILRMGALA